MKESLIMHTQKKFNWLKASYASLRLSIACSMTTAEILVSAFAADAPKPIKVVPKGTMCQTLDAKACQGHSSRTAPPSKYCFL